MATNVASHRGIIYSATGEFWLGEAITSAKSSRRFNNVPHLIFSDVSSTERIEGVDFEKYSSTGDPFLDKISSIESSPFEQTIFLDTDTYVTANLDELFDLLRRFDVAAAYAQGYTKHPDIGQSEAFFDFNTGVITYRKTTPVVEFLANWAATYKRWIESPPFSLRAVDQAPFRRALWESALAFYVLSPEYNYRSQYVGRLVGSAKIIHGRVANYEKLAAHINAATGPRVFDKFSSDAW
jgi:hypothetical protein